MESVNTKETSAKDTTKGGLKIERLFTKGISKPLENIDYESRECVIFNSKGEKVFEMTDCEIPKSWSQVATDIMISKYFRKAGVPQYKKDGTILTDESGKLILGPEKSAKQVVKRLAACWRYWGQKYNYFASNDDAENFEAELQHMLINQMAAPNSPQWFNTGLNTSYGITGPAQGHFYCDPDTGLLTKSTDAYTHPQPHACFIQSVSDDLVNEGGIMDLWTREARLFKYGSGTGTNFSNIRGANEPLSGGGFSSGLMSFLRIGDRAAGAIKSGGTTRRAAKMVCLDLDHPDIESFVNWKVEEEKKVAALIAAGYDSAYDGEAYGTVAGQNSNNSVRIPHEFMKSLKEQGTWDLKWRVDGSTCKTIESKKLWQDIAKAAWHCADPGVQYDGTINDWHTCPKDGRINASNPCSEYMFLDNTACNLASINLVHFFDKQKNEFKITEYLHAIRIWTIVLEISVLMAQFPSKEIAELSYKYRTLGLGYANLGSILMRMGIPYDSEQARQICGSITAILTGESYRTSAELAKVKGAFIGYESNKEDMLRVIRNHRRAAYNADSNEYENLVIKPQGIDANIAPKYLLETARNVWDKALELGEIYGYRNAQTTVIAPTGTIGLLMDCDTTGIEPDFSLVKFKKLAGGGYFKIVNQSVKPALENLNYNDQQIKEILQYIVGTQNLRELPEINHISLQEKGLTLDDIAHFEGKTAMAFSINDVFANYNIPADLLNRLNIGEKELNSENFNLLKHLGFSNEQISKASKALCGNMKIEGAPHLLEQHYQIFDCANKNADGQRFIHHNGHIKMMAAAQSFISGAISKTINMPNEATVEDIEKAYELSYELGVKANAIYRDGSKLSQPLSSKKDDEDEKETNEAKQEEPKTETSVVKETIIQDERGKKYDLPIRRHGITIESSIGGQKVHLRTGEYKDGKLGEIFIDMFKEGASYRSLLNALAVAVSIGLQYGVPLEKFVEKFTFTRFEPSGMTNHPNIKTCTSIVDFVFRALGMEYLQRTDFVHVKPIKEEVAKTTTPEKEIEKSDTIENEQKTSSLDEHLSNMMGDAPPCNTCGHITVRNGACYKCLNCGNSLGCS